jgi:hypothetical protein
LKRRGTCGGSKGNPGGVSTEERRIDPDNGEYFHKVMWRWDGMGFQQIVNQHFYECKQADEKVESYRRIAVSMKNKLTSALKEYVDSWPSNSTCPIKYDAKTMTLKLYETQLKFTFAWSQGIANETMKPSIWFEWTNRDQKKISGLLAEYRWQKEKWFGYDQETEKFGEWDLEYYSIIKHLLSDFVQDAIDDYTYCCDLN